MAAFMLRFHRGGMRLRYPSKKDARNRFERFNIVLAILLAGWVPSILVLWLSYTILSNTLESKIVRDRQAFVQLVGHLVGDDLSRTGGIVRYDQASPEFAKILASTNPQAAAQQWLSSTFYSHPRIDGMFITDGDGRLIASIPANHGMIGKDFDSSLWLAQTSNSNEVFVSPVHQRPGDNRLATEIVGAVRSADKKILGYLGVSVLAERIGSRLSTVEFAEQSTCQIVDQHGKALFTTKPGPNGSGFSVAEERLIKEVLRNKQGHLERFNNLYWFSPVESTTWIALLEQPKAVAFKSVYDWRVKTTVLAGWLMGLTAVFAWLSGLFYQRQTEAARQLEREVLFNEKILANMPIGIAFVDPTSRKFLHANEAFDRMARRFGGLPCCAEITEVTYDDVKIAPVDAIEKVLSFGTPFQSIEQPFKDETGATHFVNVNLLRLQGSQQIIEGVLYLIEDKTGDVISRRELITANASKDQFLALLSHELRNPLSPVIAMVGELEETAAQSPRTRQALEVIRRNVELEARLIDDLLDVTRIAKGKLQLTFEVVDVHEILERAFEICRKDIAAKNIEAGFDLAARQAFVEGDSARLQQVFWNLIKNSVKFTPARGHLTIATRNSSTGEVEIKISDTGIGIEKEKIDKIFNAFEQGQTSITRQFGGLGLGLAISKAMVEAHGGKVSVASAGKDRGATFTVSLKTVPAPSQAKDKSGRKTPRELEQALSAQKPLILLVDDHVDTCIGMKRMLERHGYKVATAHSADQALARAHEQKFDLLISDIGLPDRSGYDLMRELHERKGLRGIALSGYGMENDVTSAQAAGFSDHLTKPINFERLEESIRSLVGVETTS